MSDTKKALEDVADILQDAGWNKALADIVRERDELRAKVTALEQDAARLAKGLNDLLLVADYQYCPEGSSDQERAEAADVVMRQAQHKSREAIAEHEKLT